MVRRDQQFLTAIFGFSPSRTKEAALEAARAAQEAFFWVVLDDPNTQKKADSVIGANKTLKDISIQEVIKSARSLTKLTKNIRGGLLDGALALIESQVRSYIELRAVNPDTSWPTRHVGSPMDYELALKALANTHTRAEEFDAVTDLQTREHKPKKHPLRLVRNRDCEILRTNGKLYAKINVSVFGRKTIQILSAERADTRSPSKGSTTKTHLLVPLTCSRWHENKYLSQNAELRSATILPIGDHQWEFHGEFCFSPKQVPLSGNVIGIDRGCVWPIAAVVLDKNGRVITQPQLMGQDIVAIQVKRDSKLRAQQKNGKYNFSDSHKARSRRRLDYGLHCLANQIVEQAQQNAAVVVMEDLDSLKSVIKTKRIKNTRHGGWRKFLKKAQLAKFEQILNYKLKMAGLPAIKTVMASGTSQECPNCAHRCRENRRTRDNFSCVECGFSTHADLSAAIVIGRRGLFKLKKGDNLGHLHKNMVEQLRLLDDSGLGPFNSGRVVATHAAADGAYDSSEPIPGELTSSVGQNRVSNAAKNPIFGYSQSVAAPNLVR